MSSWVVEYTSQESNSNSSHDEYGNERLELLQASCNPTDSSLLVPADVFLRRAISFKDLVVKVTWRNGGKKGSLDPTVYTGVTGTALTCLRSYEATGNRRDLQLCAEIVDACASAVQISNSHVTFLCGRGGVYAIGAIMSSYRGDLNKRDFYLDRFLEVFPSDREFRDAAVEAGEVVWKNGLVKKVGLADGTAGNAYAFLSLLRLTGESIYEQRAKAFASYLYHNTREIEKCPPGGAKVMYSLFEGLGGAACLWFDLLAPKRSRFPGYEI